jgi:hypothetical protein
MNLWHPEIPAVKRFACGCKGTASGFAWRWDPTALATLRCPICYCPSKDWLVKFTQIVMSNDVAKFCKSIESTRVEIHWFTCNCKCTICILHEAFAVVRVQ